MAIVQCFAVLDEGLQVQLQIELESGDHRGHVIVLFVAVFEVFVDEGVSDRLVLEFIDQFRD